MKTRLLILILLGFLAGCIPMPIHAQSEQQQWYNAYSNLMNDIQKQNDHRTVVQEGAYTDYTYSQNTVRYYLQYNARYDVYNVFDQYDRYYGYYYYYDYQWYFQPN